ncbi:MAG: hypothetical protein ACR2MQ_07365 [Gemmatimonadaceae bacterium]
MGPDFAYRVPGGKHVRRAEIDPRQALPDKQAQQRVAEGWLKRGLTRMTQFAAFSRYYLWPLF